jgi:GNAT superfamily N-acetyltransferase/predicted nucleic acid-binding protein
MRVVQVADGSPEYEAVLRLWRANSDTLGHMPRGGFADGARAGQLAVATDGEGAVVGYVMFRRSARRTDVSVAHLCVAPSARGAGVAELLFEHVKQRALGCCDIRLKCRRDFEHANHLWQRLGFTAVGDSPGRGRDGVLTTTWRYPLAELPLLQRLADANRDDRVRAVIDANVFFDLDEQVDGNEESRALVADWLDDFVALAVTEELLNEINRRGVIGDRERQRRRAATFPVLPRETVREDALVVAIQRVLPSTTANETSDVKQLAMAAAADARFFVTRDTDFLTAAEELHRVSGVRIVQPHELVLRFDELRREEEYRPARLFLGPTVSSRLARDSEIERIALLMHDGQPPPEGLRRTRARLRSFLAAPTRFEVRCIPAGDTLLAAFVLQREPDELRVPFFAVQNSLLGRTAARHWGEDLVAQAIREGRSVVRVSDAGERVADALADLEFEHDGTAGWIKIALTTIGGPEDVARSLEAVKISHADVAAVADAASRELRALTFPSELRQSRCAAVERALWPAKVLGAQLPSFIVPIQPRWAKDLFDVELAALTLFGAADPSLVMNCENVYYRAASPAVLTAPARVLWYVSRDPAYPNAMAIRACSQIEEVVVGTAKDLFRRYQRLGVYKWSDVSALTGGNAQKEIMAFRFSKTELFRRPLPWRDLQELLAAETGKRSPLVSPVRVPESFFDAAYRQGVRGA